MNTRRKLIVALGACAVATPLSSFAQQPAKIARIGVLWQTTPPPPVHPQMAALLTKLHDLGWQDGKTVAIEYRYGGNDADRLARFADELVRLKVDVITTSGDQSTRAAQQATNTIPIVANVGFPVESGFVKSLARPDGNITGFVALSDALSAKRLELLKVLLPRLTRVAVLRDPVTHERQPQAALEAARTLGLQVQVLQARSANELAGAFETASAWRAEALLVLVSPTFTGNRADLVRLAARHRMPAMYPNAAFTEAGGLIAYGPAAEELARIIAVAIDKILKGAKPADIPFEQPTRFEMIVNLKTAKALGIKIPGSILVQATKVIE